MSSFVSSSCSTPRSILLHSTGDSLIDWFSRITNKKRSLFYDEESCKSEINVFKQELNINYPKDLIKASPRVAKILSLAVTGNNDREIVNSCLEFFHNHPKETLLPESLERLARAFTHSAHWVKKDYFEPIFNFMKTTPVVFQEECILRSLAEVLSGSAFWMCHSDPSFDADRSEAQAKQHFEWVKDYIVASGLQANPVFQEELKALIAQDQDNIARHRDDETRLVRRAYTIEQLVPLRIL